VKNQAVVTRAVRLNVCRGRDLGAGHWKGSLKGEREVFILISVAKTVSDD